MGENDYIVDFPRGKMAIKRGKDGYIAKFPRGKDYYIAIFPGGGNYYIAIFPGGNG